MISAPIIALGIMNGNIRPEFITMMPLVSFFDAVVWGTILYNIRDLWRKK